MSHSPERQLDLLFSGSREILNEEKDVIDCIKIFLMSLSKLPVYSSCIRDTYIHVRIKSIVGTRYPSFVWIPFMEIRLFTRCYTH